jgi:hypothetical protein
MLFVTGYADTAAFGDIGEAGIIKKPFVGDELATKVRAALTSVDTPSGNIVRLRR